MIPRFEFVRPTSLKQAIKELASKGSQLHAGGTDLMGCLRDSLLAPAKLISLSGIPELRGIQATDNGGLRIGAMTTLSEIAAHPLIRERYQALSQAAASAASPQLRNQGTIGGNLCQRPRCWYFRGDFECFRKGGNFCYGAEGQNVFHCIFGGDACYMVHPSDTAPALTALGAVARIHGPAGPRNIGLDSFYVLPSEDIMRETSLQPDEILLQIELPPVDSSFHSSYHKVRARGAWDFALAGVALAFQKIGGRAEKPQIVLSGVAPVPWRAKEAESAMAGQPLEKQLASRVADSAITGAKPLKQNAYKIQLVRAIVEQAILEKC